MLARLAVAELRGADRGAGAGAARRHARLARSRPARWRPTATDPPDAACVDFYLRPYDRNSGVEEAMQAYLSWEIDLVHEIERDGTVRFGVSEAANA